MKNPIKEIVDRKFERRDRITVNHLWKNQKSYRYSNEEAKELGGQVKSMEYRPTDVFEYLQFQLLQNEHKKMKISYNSVCYFINGNLGHLGKKKTEFIGDQIKSFLQLVSYEEQRRTQE